MRSSIPIFAVLTFGAVFISSSVNTAPNSQPSTPSEKVKIEKESQSEANRADSFF